MVSNGFPTVDQTEGNPKWVDRPRGPQAQFSGVAKSFAGETNDGQPAGLALHEQITQIRDQNLATMQSVPTMTKVMSTLLGFDHILLEPLSPSIGTVVHGINCAAITAEQAAAIRALWLRRKVPFFRNQGHLTHEQHVDFGRKFGSIRGCAR